MLADWCCLYCLVRYFSSKHSFLLSLALIHIITISLYRLSVFGQEPMMSIMPFLLDPISIFAREACLTIFEQRTCLHEVKETVLSAIHSML